MEVLVRDASCSLSAWQGYITKRNRFGVRPHGRSAWLWDHDLLLRVTFQAVGLLFGGGQNEKTRVDGAECARVLNEVVSAEVLGGVGVAFLGVHVHVGLHVDGLRV